MSIDKNILLDNENVHFISGETKSNPKRLFTELKKYDVIIFDVIDVLVSTPFLDQKDFILFLSSFYLEQNDFQEIYDLAYQDARQANCNNKCKKCLDIFDIYRELCKYIQVDPLQAAKVEMNLMLEICRANSFIYKPYTEVMYKNIIALSNLHMPAEWTTTLLQKCGYSKIQKVYNVDRYYDIESICHASKCDQLKGKIAYISKLNHATEKNARIKQWDIYYYPPVTTLGRSFRPQIIDRTQFGLSPLIGSAYCGIVNSKLYSGSYKWWHFYDWILYMDSRHL